MSASLRAQRALVITAALALSGCSWFTDFKQQPKIDPWESANDSVPPRANPQGSVPITGLAAPVFAYSRDPNPTAHLTMAGIPNPIAADSASISRGRVLFQINCAVCHGPLGNGQSAGGKVDRMLFGADLVGPAAFSQSYTDGRIFGIIRNGSGVRMPSYVRLEENERWDVINYLRALQGKGTITADTSHGRPGETGRLVPGASPTAPTRPAPYFRVKPATAPPATKAAAPPPVHPPDTTKGARS